MRKESIIQPAELEDPDAAFVARRGLVEQFHSSEAPWFEASQNADWIIAQWQARYYKLIRCFTDRIDGDELFPPIGLAAFRAIADYVLVEAELDRTVPYVLGNGPEANLSRVYTLDDLAQTFRYYRTHRKRAGTDAQGKVTVKPGGNADTALVSLIEPRTRPPECRVTLGGQAANIAILWRAMGGDPRLFVPMHSERLVEAIQAVAGVPALDAPAAMPDIRDIKVGLFNDGKYSEVTLAGAPRGLHNERNERVRDAPSGGSIAVVDYGYRQLWTLEGFRDLAIRAGAHLPIRTLEIFWGRNPDAIGLARLPVEQPSAVTPDPLPCLVWPHLTLFGETHLEGNTLRVRLATQSEVSEAFTGAGAKAAVLGGLDNLFKDQWFAANDTVRKALTKVALAQLAGLHAAGIPVGVEMSGAPNDAYYAFIQAACQRGYITTVGANGEEPDELQAIVRERRLLDQEPIDPVLLTEATARKPTPDYPHFEYLTCVRGAALRKALGVPTLYIHTTNLDYVVSQRPLGDEFERMQAAAMIGKVLGLAGVLYRNYGRHWLAYKKCLPPVVKPQAMTALFRFVADCIRFGAIQPTQQAEVRQTGRFRPQASPFQDCSVAVLPVLWPAWSEKDLGEHPDFGFRPDFNTTGAGDMAFGAFFLLQNEEIETWTPTRATPPPVTA